MPFQKGQSGNPKGAPKGGQPGAGRPSNDFRKLCAEALNEVDGIALAKSIVAGVKFPTSFGPMPAKPEVRLDAVKWLADRAHGKAPQTLEHKGDVGSRLIFMFPEDK